MLCGWFSGVVAQNKPNEATVIVAKATDQIVLDGDLDEQSWLDADVAKDFFLTFPVDTTFAHSQTEVKMTFDDQALYFGIVCHDPTPGDYIVESLKRDFPWRATENISIYFSPFNDKTTGFNFSLSPYNVQREGMISASEDISEDWDNKWFSEVQNFEDRWVVEIKIPFKTIRYVEDIRTWNLQFIRNDVKNNERSAWTAVPQQYRTNNLTFAGKMEWADPPPPAGANISVIPYVLGSTARDYEEGDEQYRYDANTGFDAKVAVTSSLNLDLTVNPDFSQVEVDQQVTNLDRFEIFFPEKRQFFLENSDLFNQNGFPPSRPFFSRRIGIAQDTAGNAVQIPILFGARLSGKLDEDWRIGVLNMQTGTHNNTLLTGTPDNGGTNLSGQNYSVGVVQRRVFARSTLGAMVVNRQATNFNPEDTTNATSAYNRVFGADFELATEDNKWQGSAYLHGSQDPEAKAGNVAFGSFLRYAIRNFNIFYFSNMIGEGYNAELGFVPRKGVSSFGSEAEGIFYPSNSNIVTHGPSAGYFVTYKTGGELADRNFSIGYGINFDNTAEFSFSMNQTYLKLFNDFDPSRSGGAELPAGSDYDNLRAEVNFQSDGRKALSYEAGTSFGGYFNGTLWNVAISAIYKFRPFGSISVDAAYNDIVLPEGYNSKRYLLIGPKLDITFTDQLFLNTFVQYNNQNDNMNINARFQWRFAPVSDLFIVYTDNYLPTDWSVKNRALVMKLSYWFNI